MSKFTRFQLRASILCALLALLLASCNDIERSEPGSPAAESQTPSTQAQQEPTPDSVAAWPPPMKNTPIPSDQDRPTPGPQQQQDDATSTPALGAIYSPEKTTFAVFAPAAESANILLFSSPEATTPISTTPLEKSPHGIWQAEISGNLEGNFYAYSFNGPGYDPKARAVDPYAVNTVASGRLARITNLQKTNPPGWDKLRKGPTLASPVDAVVWQVHIRDLTSSPTSGVINKKLYLGWTEAGTSLPGNPRIKTALDHIAELGVTHVHIMPVQDFQNDEDADLYNWGYATNFFFSPEGLYATNKTDDSRIREFKALVAALHERGIGVVLDVAYNHTGSTEPLERIAPGYYFRKNPDGSLSNGSGCGNDVRTEAPMARRLIIDSLKFWVTEYGVDGFRFDLMGLMDIETMQQAERELRTLRPGILLYGEPWTIGQSPMDGTPLDKTTLGQTTYAAFNDDFRNALKGYPDGDSKGFIQEGAPHLPAVLDGLLGRTAWTPQPSQSINYMTCHDNLVLYDKLKLSRPDASRTDILRMTRLGYFCTLLAQGIPFIHSGEEFLRSKGGNHNSYEAPDAVNQINWQLKADNLALNDYVRSLIALRASHPVFRLRTRDEVNQRINVLEASPSGSTILYQIHGAGLDGESWQSALIAINASHTDSATYILPETSRWQVILDDPDPGRRASLSPGKLRLAPVSAAVLAAKE